MGKLAVYRFFAGWIARIIRPIKVIGEKKLEKEQSIFCINHTSNWDAVAQRSLKMALANYKEISFR